MKKILSSIFLLLIFSAANAQQENETLQHTADWPSVLKSARQQNKLIFVDCYFTGCHPCAQMDKEVFPNENISREINDNFIGIKVDVLKEKLGDTINIKYGVSGFPTFLILDQAGRLISMFTGYKDAGLLLNELVNAKQKLSKNELLTGFSVPGIEGYPDFYKKYFDKEDRKADPVTANAWIKQQKDWTKPEVALPILKTGKLDIETEQYLLNNYTTYKSMYGESLLIDKVAGILTNRLNKAVNKEKNDPAFLKFLAENNKLFPAADWSILRFIVGYNYYGAISKDTTALLHFMNDDPVVYMNYFGAMYNNMLVRKQLNTATLELLCKWVDKAITAETSFELIYTAAMIQKQNNNTAGYRRFITMALQKAKKYNIPADRYEKMLSEG